MNNFSRTELKLILEGLDTIRERMREEAEFSPVPLPGDEYNELRCQLSLNAAMSGSSWRSCMR